MLQAARLTIPANTAQTSPSSVTVPLPAGVVTWVGLLFPTGCVGLAHARLLRASHQVWPSDLDADVAANGQLVGWDDHYPVLDTPHEIRLEGWNTDDTYPHTLSLFVEIADPADLQEERELRGFFGRLRQLLGL